jgi:hypothetical protein
MCCVYDGLEPHNHYEPQQDTNNPVPSRILKQATSSSWQHRGSSGIRLDDITKGGKSAIVEPNLLKTCSSVPRNGPRHVGAPGRLIIWLRFTPIFLKYLFNAVFQIYFSDVLAPLISWHHWQLSRPLIWSCLFLSCYMVDT